MAKNQTLREVLRSVGIVPPKQGPQDKWEELDNYFHDEAIITIKNGKVQVALGEYTLYLLPDLERVDVHHKGKKLRTVLCPFNSTLLMAMNLQLLSVESVIANITLHTLEDHVKKG